MSLPGVCVGGGQGVLPSFWSSATSSCENPSILQKYCAENVMKIMPNIYGELVNGNGQGLRISYYFFFNYLLRVLSSPRGRMMDLRRSN